MDCCMREKSLIVLAHHTQLCHPVIKHCLALGRRPERRHSLSATLRAIPNGQLITVPRASVVCLVSAFRLCKTIVMNIVYRTMSIGDYAKVSNLWSTSDGTVIRTSDSEEHIAKYLSRNYGLSFVAESHGEIVGSILAGHDGKRGYIQHLVVSLKFRSAGIGSQLVSHCIIALNGNGNFQVTYPCA